MSFTLCSSGAIVLKAGKGVNSDIAVSGAALAQYATEAEGIILVDTLKDWVTDYANVSTVTQGILTDVCSSLAATSLVIYDTGGYPSTRAAETLLDVLSDRANKGLKTLREKNKAQDFMI